MTSMMLSKIWLLALGFWPRLEQADDLAKGQEPIANSRFLKSRRERQQGDVARLLDRVGQAALVRSANSGEAPRDDLAALGHELAKQAHVLIVDSVDLLDAEFANLLAAEILFVAARPTTRPPGRARS